MVEQLSLPFSVVLTQTTIKTMRKVFLIMLLLVGLSITVGAKDYVHAKRQSVAYTDSTTTDTYTISSVKYSVFKSKSSAFYI